MFGRRESLRDLICAQREESARRHQEFLEESRKRDVEFREESRKRDEEFREFMRETALRFERVYGPMITEMEESTRQIRANTEAVLRLLDRFDAPGGAAA